MKKVDPAQVTPFGGSKPKSASVFTPKSTASVPQVAPKSASAPMAVTSVVPAVMFECLQVSYIVTSLLQSSKS